MARLAVRLVERVRLLPGVEAVSLAGQLPLARGGMSFLAKVEGYVPQPGESMSFDYNFVGPDYFRTMKIPLLHGREFSQLDSAAAPKVAIINETAARQASRTDPMIALRR